MYDRPLADGAGGVVAWRRARAIDIALTVAAQTEWLAGRPTIVPIVAPELDVSAHIRAVAVNANHLAEGLARTLQSDTLVQHQDSDVVDAVSDAVAKCRLFAHRWSSSQHTDTQRFNDDVAHLRHDVDQVMRSLTP
jgi:hypothetical protein